MPNVFDVLRKDHEEVKRVLTELEAGPTAASGAGADQLQLREKLVEQLIIEESKHEAVEEEYFWPAVRAHVTGGDRLADQAIEQEQKAKYVLNDLIGLDPRKAEFEELLGTFITDGRAHIAFEESQVWPQLREALDPAAGERTRREAGTGKEDRPYQAAPAYPAEARHPQSHRAGGLRGGQGQRRDHRT